MSLTQLVQVAAKAAIVSSAGNVLILREADTGKNNVRVGSWGLPGGRLEAGETFLEGLQREILEETGLQVKVDGPLQVGEWYPVIQGVPHHIIAVFMLCKSATEVVRLSTEHDRYEWIKPAARNDFVMMEPDCFVVDKLLPA